MASGRFQDAPKRPRGDYPTRAQAHFPPAPCQPGHGSSGNAIVLAPPQLLLSPTSSRACRSPFRFFMLNMFFYASFVLPRATWPPMVCRLCPYTAHPRPSPPCSLLSARQTKSGNAPPTFPSPPSHHKPIHPPLTTAIANSPCSTHRQLHGALPIWALRPIHHVSDNSLRGLLTSALLPYRPRVRALHPPSETILLP